MGVATDQIFHFEKDFLIHTSALHRHHGFETTVPGSDFFAFEDVAAIPRPQRRRRLASASPRRRCSTRSGAAGRNRRTETCSPMLRLVRGLTTCPPSGFGHRGKPVCGGKAAARAHAANVHGGHVVQSIAESKPRRQPTSVRPHSDAG